MIKSKVFTLVETGMISSLNLPVAEAAAARLWDSTYYHKLYSIKLIIYHDCTRKQTSQCTHSCLILFLTCHTETLCNIFRSNTHRKKTVPGLGKEIQL